MEETVAVVIEVEMECIVYYPFVATVEVVVHVLRFVVDHSAVGVVWEQVD